MKKLFLLSILMTMFLFSCQKGKENNDETSEQLKLETIETGACFNFVYPIGVVFRDETTVRISDNLQFRRLMLSCGDERCFGFVYPLSVIFRDGHIVTVNNDQQMRRIYAGCD